MGPSFVVLSHHTVPQKHVCVACIYLIKDIRFYINMLSTQAINWIQRLRRIEYLNIDMVSLQLQSTDAMLNDLLVRALNEPERYAAR